MNYFCKASLKSFIFLLFASHILVAQSVYTLETGTKIFVAMDNEITSKSANVNDTFTVTVAKPVIVRGIEVLPIGSVIEGKINGVSRAGRNGKSGELSVNFEKLSLPDKQTRTLDASLFGTNDEFLIIGNKLRGNSAAAQSALIIGGATGIGLGLGAAVGKSKGAAVGGGVGFGAGILSNFLKKGNEARISAKSEFQIVLNQNVTLPVEDF